MGAEMTSYYPMREVWNGRAAIEPVPYTETGFSSYGKAYRAMRKRGVSCTIIRGDRVAEAIRRYSQRNN